MGKRKGTCPELAAQESSVLSWTTTTHPPSCLQRREERKVAAKTEAPDSDRQRRCREKSRSPPFRDHPTPTPARCSPNKPPNSGSSPDFSTFTFTGNMVLVRDLAKRIRKAQQSVGHPITPRDRREDAEGKLRTNNRRGRRSVQLQLLRPPRPLHLPLLWADPSGNCSSLLINAAVNLVP